MWFSSYYIIDSVFYRYMKAMVKDGEVVILASYDEMANALRETTTTFMEEFGSQLFKNVKFRDSFVMIGQKGVSKGKAIEIVFITKFYFHLKFFF